MVRSALKCMRQGCRRLMKVWEIPEDLIGHGNRHSTTLKSGGLSSLTAIIMRFSFLCPPLHSQVAVEPILTSCFAPYSPPPVTPYPLTVPRASCQGNSSV